MFQEYNDVRVFRTRISEMPNELQNPTEGLDIQATATTEDSALLIEKKQEREVPIWLRI